MSVPAEVETSASGSAWVSDLALRDVASELAGALSSGSGCESGPPKRRSMTSPSMTGWLIVVRISLVSDVGEVSCASFMNCFSQTRQE